MILFSCKKEADSNTTAPQENNINSWYGCYSYSEEPVEANVGYNMMMVWSLELDPDESCRLQVDGQQTMIRYLCSVKFVNNGIQIWHEKDDEENQFPSNAFTSPLFSLSRSEDGLFTQFSAMEPMIAPEGSQKKSMVAFTKDVCGE